MDLIWLDTQSHFHLIVGSHITGKLSVEGADEAVLLNFLGRLGSDGYCLTICVDKPQAFGIAHRKMTLRQGDLVLYDSRTMHCGGSSFSATAPIPTVWFLVCSWIQAARTRTRTVTITRTRMRTTRSLGTRRRTGTRTRTLEKNNNTNHNTNNKGRRRMLTFLVTRW